MQIEVLDSYTEEFQKEWDLLLTRVGGHYAQLHSIWVKNYIRYFLNNEEFTFLIARDAKGTLISGLSLRLSPRNFYRLSKLRYISDLGNGVNDFFYIPCLPGFEEKMSEMYARWFYDNRTFWDYMRLQFLPATRMHECFAQSMKMHFDVKIARERKYFIINTNSAWDSYFTSEMNRRLRDVRGRVNRINKAGFKVESKIITQGIGHYLDEFLWHFSRRRQEKGEKNSYANKAKELLIRAITKSVESSGSVQLSILQDQNQEIWAYQLDLMDWNQGVWYHYAPTFNEKFREFSPSKVLLFESLKRAFADPRINEFNFMRGEAEYKKQFTDVSEPYMEINVTNTNSPKVKFQRLMARLLNRA